MVVQIDRTAGEDMVRKRARKKTRTKVERYTRLLYIPTALLWAVGLAMTFCSTIPSVGSGTVFWENKTTYYIVGPVVLSIGLIMLMVTVSLMYKVKKNPEVYQFGVASLVRPIVKRSYSYSRSSKITHVCPNCQHEWSTPTDIRIDVTRGNTDKCQLYISNTASPPTSPGYTTLSETSTDPLHDQEPHDNDDTVRTDGAIFDYEDNDQVRFDNGGPVYDMKTDVKEEDGADVPAIDGDTLCLLNEERCGRSTDILDTNRKLS